MCLDARRDDGLDTTPNIEVTRHLHPSRCARRGKIVEDSVHGALVEDAIVPEAPEIKLETFELETQPVRHVVDENRSEIRRSPRELTQLGGVALDAAEWAERRELRALHTDGVFPIGVWVLEGLEELWLRHGCTMARPRGAR